MSGARAVAAGRAARAPHQRRVLRSPPAFPGHLARWRHVHVPCRRGGGAQRRRARRWVTRCTSAVASAAPRLRAAARSLDGEWVPAPAWISRAPRLIHGPGCRRLAARRNCSAGAPRRRPRDSGARRPPVPCRVQPRAPHPAALCTRGARTLGTIQAEPGLLIRSGHVHGTWERICGVQCCCTPQSWARTRYTRVGRPGIRTETGGNEW